jgi:hypothetical protein
MHSRYDRKCGDMVQVTQEQDVAQSLDDTAIGDIERRLRMISTPVEILVVFATTHPRWV